nr:hypothetical protein [Variovorax boronicumulans]
MEAFLFTLDIFFLLLLVRAVMLYDRSKTGGLGFLSYLESKTDQVQKGIGRRGSRPDA